MDFISSTGAAVCFGDKIATLGMTPSEDQVRHIRKWTLDRTAAPIFVTDCLQDRVADAASLTDTARGVLGLTVSQAHDFHVFWFRTEQVQVMTWGGEPTKAVEFDGDSMRLSPRKSFEIWKQEVRGKSQAWLQPEIEAAAELRATLMSLLLTKAYVFRNRMFGMNWRSAVRAEFVFALWSRIQGVLAARFFTTTVALLGTRLV
jgi:light-regulated signal transduction histidine kinase (bacteriophytochrome)